MCSTDIQGTFRNAMIAEAESDYYFILDGDEIWSPGALTAMKTEMFHMRGAYEVKGALYGVCRRLEVDHDLKQVHGRNNYVNHHRVYHRTATWVGTHPGEDPRYPQTKANEHYFTDAVYMHHFHQPDRSSKDSVVPGRMNRRYKPTYVRGEITPFDILQEIPMMQSPIGTFPVNPRLKEIQNGR